jgi:hypothetical protein
MRSSGIRGATVLLAAGVGAFLALVPVSAGADVTKQQCVKANADGQVLRMSGRLTEARTQFDTCGDASCPAIVRKDCAQRLDEVERVQPTIVFDVKDASGADLSAVRVTVDGHPLTDRALGIALRADPGDHEFTFTAEGQPPITRHFVLKEGEKDRRERIVVGVAPAISAPAPASSTSAESASSSESDAAERASGGTQKVLGLVAGGTGLAGVIVGGVFGLMTFSATHQQKSDCQSSSSCADRSQALSDHAAAATDSTVSTTAFIAGGVLLAAGAVLFLTAPRAATEPTTTGWILAPSVGPGAGGVSLRGEF